MHKAFTFILLLLTPPLLCFGMGQQDTPEAIATPATSPQPRQATVTGAIRLVGNEPFTRLVLTAENNANYYLQAPKLPFLTELQGKKVAIAGLVTSKSIYTANGKFITMENALIPGTITYRDTLYGIFKLTHANEETGLLLVTSRNNPREYRVQLTKGQKYAVYQDKHVAINGIITVHLTFNEQGSYTSSVFLLRPLSINNR